MTKRKAAFITTATGNLPFRTTARVSIKLSDMSTIVRACKLAADAIKASPVGVSGSFAAAAMETVDLDRVANIMLDAFIIRTKEGAK
jgi:hypothetical protein